MGLAVIVIAAISVVTTINNKIRLIETLPSSQHLAIGPRKNAGNTHIPHLLKNKRKKRQGPLLIHPEIAPTILMLTLRQESIHYQLSF